MFYQPNLRFENFSLRKILCSIYLLQLHVIHEMTYVFMESSVIKAQKPI